MKWEKAFQGLLCPGALPKSAEQMPKRISEAATSKIGGGEARAEPWLSAIPSRAKDAKDAKTFDLRTRKAEIVVVAFFGISTSQLASLSTAFPVASSASFARNLGLYFFYS